MYGVVIIPRIIKARDPKKQQEAAIIFTIRKNQKTLNTRDLAPSGTIALIDSYWLVVEYTSVSIRYLRQNYSYPNWRI